MRKVVIIGLAACVIAYGWSVAASGLYFVGVHLWSLFLGGQDRSDLFLFPYLQWFQVAPWWQTSAEMTVCVMGSAAIPTLLLACFTYLVQKAWRRRVLRRPLGGGLKPLEPGVTDNHGHAAWPTIRQMLDRYSKSHPTHGGVVIGEARRIDLEPVKDIPYDSYDESTWGEGGKAPLLIDDCESSSPHSVVCVGTGGQKTMSALATQYHFAGSIITFDPSCEIGPMARAWREKLGQRVVFLGKGAGQQGIAALDCIKPGTPDAASRIRSMTASICGEETGRNDKNGVFESAGRNLIACLMAHMMYDKNLPDHMKTMETLVEGITIPEDQMQAKLRAIHQSSESVYARRLAGIVMGTHKETFSGTYFSATTFAGWLLDPENAKLLSGTMKPFEILDGNLSIYIQIPTGTLISDPGPGRVITDSIVSSIIQADGNYAQKMLLQADEARLLQNMKSIETVLLQGRKYGLVLNMIYTSINDMRRVWTDDGLETWLDNVGWAGFAAVSSKTAKYLSELIGKHSVMAYSEGENNGSSWQMMANGSRSKGRNTNVHEISRLLIMPEEFKDSRTDELFVIPRSGRPFRCGMAPYFRRPEMAAEITASTFKRSAAA